MRNSRAYRTPTAATPPGGAWRRPGRLEVGVDSAGNAVRTLLVLAAERLDLQAELLGEGAADETPHGVGLMPMSA